MRCAVPDREQRSERIVRSDPLTGIRSVPITARGRRTRSQSGGLGRPARAGLSPWGRLALALETLPEKMRENGKVLSATRGLFSFSPFGCRPVAARDLPVISLRPILWRAGVRWSGGVSSSPSLRLG